MRVVMLSMGLWMGGLNAGCGAGCGCPEPCECFVGNGCGCENNFEEESSDSEYVPFSNHS